jgi:hypothetical protein
MQVCPTLLHFAPQNEEIAPIWGYSVADVLYSQASARWRKKTDLGVKMGKKIRPTVTADLMTLLAKPYCSS